MNIIFYWKETCDLLQDLVNFTENKAKRTFLHTKILVEEGKKLEMRNEKLEVRSERGSEVRNHRG